MDWDGWEECISKRYEGNFGVMDIILILTIVISLQVFIYVKTSNYTVYIYINFFVYQLHLNKAILEIICVGFLFFFFWLYSWHVKVPRPGIELEP